MSKTYVYVASNPKKELLVGLTKFTLDGELLRLAVEAPAGRWDRIVYVEEFWTIGEAFARRKSLVRMGKKRLGAKISKTNPARERVTPVVPTLSFIAPWTDRGDPPGSCGPRSFRRTARWSGGSPSRCLLRSNTPTNGLSTCCRPCTRADAPRPVDRDRGVDEGT